MPLSCVWVLPSPAPVTGSLSNLGSGQGCNDEADLLAKLGAEQGTPWEFQTNWLPTPQTCAVNAITRWEQENHQNGEQTLHLGRKPGDSDLVTMQEQDAAI